MRQYRYALSQELLELPAGKIDPGEDFHAAAVRELEEETGCTAGELRYLGTFFPSGELFDRGDPPVCMPPASPRRNSAWTRTNS